MRRSRAATFVRGDVDVSVAPASSMSHPAESAPPDSQWSELLSRRIDEQRAKVRAAAQAQRERFQELEATLEKQCAGLEASLTEATCALNDEASVISARSQSLESQSAELAATSLALAVQQSQLAALREGIDRSQHDQIAAHQSLLGELSRALTELNARQATLLAQESSLASSRSEIDDARAELHEQEQALAQRSSLLDQIEKEFEQLDAKIHEREAECQAVAEKIAAQQAHLVKQEAELESRASELRRLEQRTRLERSSIAHALKARRSEMEAEIAREFATNVKADASAAINFAQELAAARIEIEHFKHLAASPAVDEGRAELEAELRELRRENSRLRENLDASEAREVRSSHVVAADPDVQRRLEMALADVRELKTRNAELSDKISKGISSPPAAPVLGGGSDWESRKKALLAQLESDYDERDPQQKAEKLTIAETIRQTDAIVEAKNNEIEELQRLLSEQSGNIGDVAIGAAAIAQMFDSDELIRQERDSLREMQEKLREQLSKAEIDLSVERAKLARERSVLEEKMRLYENEKASTPDAPLTPGDKSKQGSNRGRWLSRLGLKDGG